MSSLLVIIIKIILKNTRVVKFSRLEGNLQKQRNYFTSKISQYTVFNKCMIALGGIASTLSTKEQLVHTQLFYTSCHAYTYTSIQLIKRLLQLAIASIIFTVGLAVLTNSYTATIPLVLGKHGGY